MAKLSMECKKMMVEEISSRLNDSDTMIVTNYKGLSAQALNELRRELRGVSGEYVVVKDSMLKRALASEHSKKIVELVEGEVGIAVDRKGDASYILKVLVKFAKDHKIMQIRGGIVNGGSVSTDDIKQLASLPSREVLLAKLANVLNAPIQGLAGALNAIICKLAYVLNAVKDKKGQGTSDKGQGEVEEKTEEKKEEVQPEKKEETQPEKKEESGPENKEVSNG
ncbi:MAG: 50S ribosomal protein L10 [Candidatus Omnitrophica bacterium]|nr:50S ribosomal protein L10 [Candidatus Omnitrophota bacterium]